MPPATEITCVECGSTAHLITHLDDEDGLEAGDIITYRCSGCGDRWDLEVTEEDVAEAPEA